jgi:hypothetical protein
VVHVSQVPPLSTQIPPAEQVNPVGHGSVAEHITVSATQVPSSEHVKPVSQGSLGEHSGSSAMHSLSLEQVKPVAQGFVGEHSSLGGASLIQVLVTTSQEYPDTHFPSSQGRSSSETSSAVHAVSTRADNTLDAPRKKAQRPLRSVARVSRGNKFITCHDSIHARMGLRKRQRTARKN